MKHEQNRGKKAIATLLMVGFVFTGLGITTASAIAIMGSHALPGFTLPPMPSE